MDLHSSFQFSAITGEQILHLHFEHLNSSHFGVLDIDEPTFYLLNLFLQYLIVAQVSLPAYRSTDDATVVSHCEHLLLMVFLDRVNRSITSRIASIRCWKSLRLPHYCSSYQI